MRTLHTLAIIVVVTLAAMRPDPARAEPETPPLYESSTFPLLPILRSNVRFRVAVYGEYDASTQLYYDRKKLGVILATLDLRAFGSERARRAAVLKERRRIAGALSRLAAGKRKKLNTLETTLLAAYADTPALLRGAASRIGTRTGWKNQFAAGLRRLAQYRPSVEAVLARNGLSTELVALAMTESLFSPKARSWAGAAGYWQFLARTGKKYLHINKLVDERRDPLVSTDGAARMLKEMYAEFKAWPLVIAAYNYGPHRIARGVKALKTTDLARLMKEWGPLKYMLNSRSYYASFLAALHVMQHQDKYFPGLALPPAPRFETWRLPRAKTLKQTANQCGLPTAQLVTLNPSFTRAARGHLKLPAGYPLRLPEGTAAKCGAALTPDTPATGPLTFTVLTDSAAQPSAAAGGERGASPRAKMRGVEAH